MKVKIGKQNVSEALLSPDMQVEIGQFTLRFAMPEEQMTKTVAIPISPPTEVITKASG